MEAGELLRAARHRAGLSQRLMAQRAQVSLSALAAAEAGHQAPSWRTVEQVLAVAGLEVGLEPPAIPPGRKLVRHLYGTLSQRLYVALGGRLETRMSLRARPHPPAWEVLPDWARGARLQLVGPSAVGMWLPSAPAVTELLRTGGPADLPVVEGPVLRSGPAAPHCTVTVPLLRGVVWTPPPHSLALDPACAPWRQELRAAAALLDRSAALDRAGRRAAAHQVHEREGDQEQARWSRTWGPRFLPPDRLVARGWRLDDDVALSTWLDRRAEGR